jgi:hypothetical protein
MEEHFLFTRRAEKVRKTSICSNKVLLRRKVARESESEEAKNTHFEEVEAKCISYLILSPP